ncbi:DUF6624 domain-containing protein [Mucilaginibacter sp.]|uniref:DUF6624 domain-containing protein n=1 Tax=Mucilaginibacter sp. TaxID=1882438 RepID=UPI003AFFEB5B
MKPKIKYLLLVMLQLSVMKASAQTLYDTLVFHAHDLYKNKQFTKSALTYNSAFKNFPQLVKGWDRYNAACSWSLANNADSAFLELETWAKNAGQRFFRVLPYDHLVGDIDFNNIHSDKRWKPFIENCKEKYQSQLNLPLQATLDSILVDDQKYRVLIDTTIKMYGIKSHEFAALTAKTNQTDSINVIKVTRILDKYGWPDYATVGNKAIMAIFLVIQHANLNIQEKYLPMVKDAVEKQNLAPEDLAILEDRIAIRKGQKQIYGSQLRYDLKIQKNILFPIEDEPNVNKRRAVVGLQPLEDYLKYYHIQYKPMTTSKRQ